MHERGVVASEPGLYFVGLAFLYAASSSMIHGVGRDAEHVVQAIASRPAEIGPQEPGPDRHRRGRSGRRRRPAEPRSLQSAFIYHFSLTPN